MKLNSKKVVIGMSGGVDSSVAAALLAKQGYDVTGVSLNLLTCDRNIERSCCAPADRQDARAVAEQIGIKHKVIDCRAQFKETVIDQFIEEYLNGRTPSPCIICNEQVKFRALAEEAKRIGARYVATGHYARIEGDGNEFRLMRASFPEKDQSYFLFRMNQEELSHTLFPLGDKTKAEVRDLAQQFGLLTHKKPDSQEVCFVPDGECAAFIESRAGTHVAGPGNFVDRDGRVIGRHRGIHSYTVGQRRRLGFGIGKRQYVVRIDAERNEVVLGADDELMRTQMLVRDVTWISACHCERPTGARQSHGIASSPLLLPPLRLRQAGAMTAGEHSVTVKIRSTHEGERASLEKHDDGILVSFEKPVRAIAPGQAAVFYNGDELLGGGWIG